MSSAVPPDLTPGQPQAVPAPPAGAGRATPAQAVPAPPASPARTTAPAARDDDVRPAAAGTTVLPDPRPTDAKDARLVQDMFDRVAPRYDIANAILSFGSDQHWRRVAVNAVDPRPGERVLDVATGTGLVALEMRRRGAEVVALDFSWNMLAAGIDAEERTDRTPLTWLNGDGTALPFADDTFDAVTISFGLRNLPDPRAGLREFARVVKPGGRLCVVEFSTPTAGWFRRVYQDYLVRALPRVAEVVSSDASAYTYLAESILAWPDQHDLALWLADAGWARPRWQNLSGGIVALHMGEQPA